MLADALISHRMFIVAMQKPGRIRETPSSIAGLGLIRVSVDNPDGTSHLILQGVTRVELEETVQYKPYRTHRIRPIQAPPNDSITIDALLAKVRDLVNERVQLGLTSTVTTKNKPQSNVFSVKDVIGYLDKVNDADQVADLVSCALLPDASERQTILETVELEPRLKHLIHFLMAGINQHRKAPGNE